MPRIDPLAGKRPAMAPWAVESAVEDAVGNMLVDFVPDITVGRCANAARDLVAELKHRGLVVTRPQAELQDRATAWRLRRFPSSTPTDVLAKLAEEVGELARAVIGNLEGRPGRGDAGDEAAQAVLVVMSLIGRFYPSRNVLEDARAELERIGG